MKSKKLGVIGGMGPMATSMFLEKLILNTVAKRDQDHIDTVILNHATIPDRTEAIITKQENKFLQAIKKDIELLNYAEVDHIAIPCNTSHYFFDHIQSMTNIPIIHMVEKTAEHIANAYGNQKKVAILATNGTIESGIYGVACEKFGLEAIYSDKQHLVMDIIYQYKAGVIKGTELELVIEDCLSVDEATCVVLGCTELSCIPISDQYKRFCIDPMDVLVEQSILLSGKEVVPSFVI